MDNTTEIIGTIITSGEIIEGTLETSESIDAELEIPTMSSYTLQPATDHSLGGIIVGEDLQITPEGILSIHKATEVEEDNTRPITAAAVYAEVGNINALLATI